jgi:hypothetical protein
MLPKIMKLPFRFLKEISIGNVRKKINKRNKKKVKKSQKVTVKNRLIKYKNSNK